MLILPVFKHFTFRRLHTPRSFSRKSVCVNMANIIGIGIGIRLLSVLSIYAASRNLVFTEEIIQKETPSETGSYYIAAVVEYKPNGTPWDSTPQDLILSNVEHYIGFINDAANLNADIVVFPEYGLTTLGVPRNRESARPFLLTVPGLGNNPCKEKDVSCTSNPIQMLSCAASVNRIYVVVNLGEITTCKPELACPDDGVFQYNTNVVFDRDGKIVAKYHKTKLYFEEQFDSPAIPEHSIFKTDFGVTFGQFICYDIIFRDPAIELVRRGVQNIIYTSAWVDELPFLMAIQSQALWASSANVNFLASGYHQPLGGQLGSGIFSSTYGALNYTFDPDSGSQLVLAKVPKVPYSTYSPNELKPIYEYSTQHNMFSATYHSYLKENLSNYSSTILDVKNKSSEEICHGSFCCSINYVTTNNIKNSKPADTLNYRLIAFDGIRKTAQETSEFGWQVCAIVRCLNSSLESCSIRGNDEVEKLENVTEFELQGSPFETGNVMKPSLNTLDINLNLIPFELFNISHNSSICKISSNKLAFIPLQTIAIINRTYK